MGTINLIALYKALMVGMTYIGTDEPVGAAEPRAGAFSLAILSFSLSRSRG